MGYRLLTTIILAVHFGYLGYLVVGGFVAWRWPRTIWWHGVAAAWGLLIVAADAVAGGLTCPLTYAEDWSRQRAGQAPLTAGFIDRYLEGVIYPERYAGLAQAVAAAAVLVSWVGLRWRRRAGSPGPGIDREVEHAPAGGAARDRDRPESGSAPE